MDLLLDTLYRRGASMGKMWGGVARGDGDGEDGRVIERERGREGEILSSR